MGNFGKIVGYIPTIATIIFAFLLAIAGYNLAVAGEPGRYGPMFVLFGVCLGVGLYLVKLSKTIKT